MTATACIPITLPAADWRIVWRVLNDQRFTGKIGQTWRDEPVHKAAADEIQFRGAEKSDPFTCFLCCGDVWCWARSMPEELAARVRRQAEAYFVEVW